MFELRLDEFRLTNGVLVMDREWFLAPAAFVLTEPGKKYSYFSLERSFGNVRVYISAVSKFPTIVMRSKQNPV